MTIVYYFNSARTLVQMHDTQNFQSAEIIFLLFVNSFISILISRWLQGVFVFSFLGVFFQVDFISFHLELKRNWRCPSTPLDHWRCSLSSLTMADEAISWWRFNTRTGNFQCHSKKSENDCGSCFWEVKRPFSVLVKKNWHHTEIPPSKDRNLRSFAQSVWNERGGI